MSIEKHPTKPEYYYVKSYPNGRNGKVHRDLVQGYDAALALDMAIKKRKGATAPQQVLRPRLSLIVDDYLAWADRNLSAETMIGKRRRITHYLMPFFGVYRVCDLTQALFDDYAKNVTPINYRLDISHLLAMIRWAHKRNLCDRLAFSPELPRYSAPIKTLPSIADTIKFLIAVKNPLHRVCMELMLYTGLRWNEAKHLTWDNYRGDHFIVRKTKTKRDRIIWIPEQLNEWFKEHTASGYVFSVTGGKTPLCNIDRAIKWARDKSGVHLTPHLFRHMAATIYYRQTKDLYAVSKMLGHSRITTSEVYARYAADVSRQATNVISDAFELTTQSN